MGWAGHVACDTRKASRIFIGETEGKRSPEQVWPVICIRGSSGLLRSVWEPDKLVISVLKVFLNDY
jgi:hypothetical protein